MYRNIQSISPPRRKYIPPPPYFSAKVLQRGNLYQYTPTSQFVPGLHFIHEVNVHRCICRSMDAVPYTHTYRSGHCRPDWRCMHSVHKSGTWVYTQIFCTKFGVNAPPPPPPRFGTNALHKGVGVYSEFYGTWFLVLHWATVQVHCPHIHLAIIHGDHSPSNLTEWSACGLFHSHRDTITTHRLHTYRLSPISVPDNPPTAYARRLVQVLQYDHFNRK